MVQKQMINKLGVQADHVISEKGSSCSFSQNKGDDLKKKMKKSRLIKRSDIEGLRSTTPLRNEDVSQAGKPPTPDQVKTRAATPLRQSPGKFPGEWNDEKLQPGKPTTFDQVKSRAATPRRPSPARALGAWCEDIRQPGKPPTSDQIKSRAATPRRPSPAKAPGAWNEDIAQSGKPHTSDQVKSRAATPRRQSPAKAQEDSPNYMKSTSSFDARKERSQVSSQTPQNVMIRKSMSPMKSNNSRYSSGSDYHKAAGVSARTSSLKLVRTLTKTTSFKPARASAKKYSPIVLCEDFDVQKPTCSSTLKDSKFPSYLELSAGATESEGTSAMKVCPYTYCSLNGHHHAPVPPLKSFLSAKRRMMQAQKIMKFGCLSPRRGKPTRERMIKINAKQVILDKMPPTKKKGFDIRPMTPLIDEKQTDFFIEIYGKNRDDITEEKKAETLSSTAPCPVTDYEEYQDQSCNNTTATLNDVNLLNQTVEAGVDSNLLPLTQEEERLDCLSTQGNSDEKSQPDSRHEQSDADAADMEWEAEHLCELNLSGVPVVKVKVTDIMELMSKSVDDVNDSNEDMAPDVVLVGFYDEKSVNSSAWSDDGDSDLEGSYQNSFFDDSYLASNEKSLDKIHSTCDALDDLTSTGEEHGNSESVQTLGKENIISDHIEELQATTVEKKQVSEVCDETPKMNTEVLFDLQEDDASQEEYVSWLLQNQDCNSVQDFIEQDQDETHKDYNASHTSMEDFEHGISTESRFSDNVSGESILEKNEYEEADQGECDQGISTADANEGIEEKENSAIESSDIIQTSILLECYKQETHIADATDDMEENEQIFADKSSIESQTFELLQDFRVPAQHKLAVNDDQSKQNDVTIENETTQTCIGEILPFGSYGAENHEYSEMNKNQLQTFKYTGSEYSEDQMHSGSVVLQATPKQNQEAYTREEEYTTESHTAEASFVSASSTNTQNSDHMSNASSNSDEETTNTVKNSSWTRGSKKTVPESDDDIRDFNPREPNYLPLEPDLEAEKVDLRHQMMDERRNAEEWMVDYALRQAVTKLAPARRRKVALLVEAFEKVSPTPKYESYPKHTSPAFVHGGTIQACR